MDKLETALQQALGRYRADIDRQDGLWDASVLVPLVDMDGVPSILFEVRAQTLHRQPGEICFPGGKYECKDASFAVTAVRETCEELGLTASDIIVLGELDKLVTFAGLILHPFLGKLKDVGKLKISRAEVESVFTVPLAFLLHCTPKLGYMHLGDKPREDFPFALVPQRMEGWRTRKEYAVYFYEYEDKIIWGLTARMLHAFLENWRQELEQLLEA